MKNSKQTTLDLNGPILSFTSQPVGVASTGVISGTGSGIATFTGIATASFNTVGIITNPATGTGYVTYRWYEVGVGALSDSTYVTGTATTTLTLSRLITPTDNQRQFYLEADYVPSAYGLAGVAVTVGSARSTANAINEPISSETATLTVYPNLEIVGQPSNRTVATNTNTTFTVDAGLTDTSFSSELSYQWYLNGVAVDDGVIATITSATRADLTYTSDSSIDLPSDSTDIEVTLAGARGGNGGSDAGGPGGGGANGRAGKFTLTPGGRTLTFRIGRSGNGGGSGNFPAYGGPGSSNVASGGRGGGAGGSGWSGGGGGGGGATGVYDSSIGNYAAVAGGGGGGGGGSWNRGANPGSTAGGFSSSSGSFDISNGGQGEDKGGDGGGGGGGGGGATGGGGGYAGQDNAYGGGGGSGAGSRYNSNVATYQDQWENGGDGYANLKFTTQTTIPGITVVKTRKTTISGTKTPTLTISTDSVGIQTVRCVISSSIATNSPILTDVVNFVAVSTAEQYNLNVEAVGNSSTGTVSAINLANGDYTITTASGDPNTGRYTEYYSLYSPDKDINVEMDLYGGKGTNSGSNSGGEGGFSRVRFTMTRNTEYVIAGLTEDINTPFVYRKGQLIACVGKGGNAGTSGRGGFGGGVNVSGDAGFGRDNGSGGAVVAAGNLGGNGILGSLTSLVPSLPDTKAAAPNGGRALKCTKGIYWQQQGVSACSDVGTVKFRLSDGTEVTNTASIARGYKAGYDIIQTAGRGSSNGGSGGNGATGGAGGVNGSGGGGGSGYTDGSVTVVNTQLGGSTGNARVVLRYVS